MSDLLRKQYIGGVISIGGPPHSGKSVFVSELFRKLGALFSKDVFLERACPDGEGQWSSESDAKHVQLIRRKQAFSDEFVKAKCNSIERLGSHFRITLVDLGGKIAPDTHQLMTRSTHCILLGRSDDDLDPWADAAETSGCRVLARLHSRHIHDEDGNLSQTARSDLQMEHQPWGGVLVNLDRDASTTPYSQALDQLVDALADEFLCERA